MPSTLDELEEIERSARVGPGRSVSPTAPTSKGDRRRGSSCFTGVDAMAEYKDSTVNTKGGAKGQMLEDFPKRNTEQPAPVKPPENVSRPTPPAYTAVKRGSVALKPMSGLGGLVDFDDSDFDDSDEELDFRLPGAPMPGSAEAVGGPNHRPLVGGFAAAAYEAARAHHYQSVNKPTKPVEVPKRRGPPPSI